MAELKTDLLRARWKQIAGVCPPKAKRDIYQHVRIDADDAGNFILHATDGEMYVSIGDCSEPTFSRLLPVKRFSRLMEVAAAETIDLAAVTIKCGSDEWDLQSPPIDDWEFRAITDTGRQYWVEAIDLKTSLQIAQLSIDEESTRYALGGVLLDFVGSESLAVVATDGRRMSVNQIPCECSGEPDFDVKPVVPAKTIKQILAALKPDGRAAFSFGTAGGIVVDTGETVIYSPLVQGRFPDWSAIVPDGSGQRFDLPAGELSAALKSASIVTSDESRGVDCTLSHDGITATASGADVGRSCAQRSLLFESEAEFRCNPDYLLPLLNKVGSDRELCLTYTGGEAPVMFSHDGGLTYVLMPIATS